MSKDLFQTNNLLNHNTENSKKMPNGLDHINDLLIYGTENTIKMTEIRKQLEDMELEMLEPLHEELLVSHLFTVLCCCYTAMNNFNLLSLTIKRYITSHGNKLQIDKFVNIVNYSNSQEYDE